MKKASDWPKVEPRVLPRVLKGTKLGGKHRVEGGRLEGLLRHLPLLISIGLLGYLGVQDPHSLRTLLLQALAHAFPQDHHALWGGPGSGGRPAGQQRLLGESGHGPQQAG